MDPTDAEALRTPLLEEDECLGEDFELVDALQEEDAAQDAIPEPRHRAPPPAARTEEGLWRAAAAACLKAWTFILGGLRRVWAALLLPPPPPPQLTSLQAQRLQALRGRVGVAFDPTYAHHQVRALRHALRC